MKKLFTATIIVISSLAAGCASTTGIPCYAEAGVGVWLRTTERAQNAGLIGETPTDINLYCQKGNFSVGYYHRSDIGRGAPFNDQVEWSSDALMIKYRVQVN